MLTGKSLAAGTEILGGFAPVAATTTGGPVTMNAAGRVFAFGVDPEGTPDAAEEKPSK